MSWKTEVQLAGAGGKWHRSYLAFATKAEAEANARDLIRSGAPVVTGYRAVKVNAPVNCARVDGELKMKQKRKPNRRRRRSRTLRIVSGGLPSLGKRR